MHHRDWKKGEAGCSAHPVVVPKHSKLINLTELKVLLLFCCQAFSASDMRLLSRVCVMLLAHMALSYTTTRALPPSNIASSRHTGLRPAADAALRLVALRRAAGTFACCPEVVQGTETAIFSLG